MEVRIDSFLWAVRLYKTRSLATEACKKGRVAIDGVNVKPARLVKVGDLIEVRRPPITYAYKVLALAKNRMGAKLVEGYIENVTPQEQLEQLELKRISGFIDRAKGEGRPTKRDRRALDSWAQGDFEPLPSYEEAFDEEDPDDQGLEDLDFLDFDDNDYDGF